VGVILASGAAVALGALWSRDKATDPDEVSSYLRNSSGAVADAATSVIEALMNYDSATVEDRKAELLPLATGDFKSQYEELLDGGLGEALAAKDAVSRGEITDTLSVAFTSAGKAYAVARVLQEVSSDAAPNGRTVFYVMRLTLLQEDNAWKVDRLEILSQHST
jgi:hypothetical protein